MSLLDGKYEIISQRPLSDGQTLFEATAPDGSLLRIVWYDLDREQEIAFEHYRRALKALRRSDQAALFDVVSRPGANYVAWYTPISAQAEVSDPSLSHALAGYGFDPLSAEVRRDGRKGKLYALPFDGTPPAPLDPVPSPLPTPTPGLLARARERLTALPVWVVSWTLALVLGVAAAGLFYAGFLRYANDRIVVVPDLVGRDIEEALDALASTRLVVSARAVPSDEPVGSVIASDPRPGSQLRPGRPLALSYALPPGQLAPTTMPNLVGRAFPSEVEAVLEEAGGPMLGRVFRLASEAPVGDVVGQSIETGGPVGFGQAVDLLVSSGPAVAMTFVPDLVGLELEDAVFIARVAGIAADRIVEETVRRGDPGIVLNQSLPANTPVPLDTSVLRLTVAASEPPPTSGVPSLVGMSRDAALRAAAGFRVSFDEASVLELPEGVIDQHPPPGDPLGARELTLTLNIHPFVIPTPEVRVNLRPIRPHAVSYSFFIEPGISRQVTAELIATPLSGEPSPVLERRVQGGDRLTGEWLTSEPGPIRFTLYLNGIYYREQLVSP